MAVPELFVKIIREAKEQQLKQLDLSLTFFDYDGDQLTKSLTEVFNLSQLEILTLRHNRLTKVPESIGKLTNLTQLDLSSNQLTTVPESLTKLTKLTKLNLSCNQLKTVPESLTKLTNLTQLDLSSNQLTTVPESLTKLTNLTQLDLSSNQLTTVPESLTKLTNLTQLDLRGNQLTTVPESIGKLTKLTQFDLSSNQLTTVPESFTKLTKLTQFDLSSNQLTTVPESLTKLRKLTQLDLSFNQLTTVPESLTNLTNLTKLCLRINQLKTVPDSIAKLTNLTQLDLRGNQLTKVPDSIAKLTNLTQLDLRGNQLTKVPDSIAKLTNLTQLDLRGNQLTKVPDSIAKLTNLTQLDLSFTELTTVPEFIAKLTNLTQLDLCDNQLTTVPKSITKLTHLTQLDLRGNKLKIVPEYITKLANLTQLNLTGNPLENPPIEIASNGIEAIRSYFRQLKEGKDYIYEAKLLIVGEAGAGKTTLAKKIENPNYQLQENEKSTEGIDIIKWKFPLDNGRDFRVNIWDFGGQEIYHTTHQFFLTKRSLYTLVADTRKEDTDFYYWLNIVELLSDNSPLLIIKNEKQERHREINERALRGRFTNLKETLATNLATNRGLDDLLTQIKFYISNLPHIKEAALPRTWKQVREALEEDSRNYISLDEYLQIGSNNGFTLYNDKLQLSGYLHDLGVCLHFQDDPLLNKTVILKPEWGTYAVYKVLDNNQVIRNLGCFNRADLEKIWSEENYAYMHDELLQLMIKFQLCYLIPGRKDSYIAPQLLTLNQPEYDWDESDNLILRYTYDFMPKGIITRFIVVMHKWIDQQQYVWKSGVILNKDNTKAEVIEYYEQREIKIRVTGRHKRDLLTTVIYELDQIHESYNRLRCSKLIPCNCSTCKNSQTPYFYEFDKLRERIGYGQDTIECGSPPYNTVKVLRLIDDVIGLKQFTKDEQLHIYRQQNNVASPIHINIEAIGSKTVYEESEINVGDGSNELPTEEKWNLSNKLALIGIIATLFVGLGAWLFSGLLNDKVMEWFSPDPATQQEQLD